MKSVNGIPINHINGNYMSTMEQKGYTSRPPSDCRTPIAWHNRNVNLSKPPSIQSDHSLGNYSAKYRRSSSGQRSSQRPSSPSATTTSSDDREEVPMVRHPPRRPNSRVTGNGSLTIDRRQQNHLFSNQFMGTIISGEYSVPMRGFRTGTLRSTKSVPALAMSSTLDGDPCPVHGNGLVMHACHPYYPPITAPQTLNMRRFGSIADIREARLPIASNTLPFLAPIPENKQSCGLMPVYYTPPPQTHISPGLAPNQIPLHIMSSKLKSRPVIFPAYSEPLPFRSPLSPFKVSSPVPSTQTVKIGNNYDMNSEDVCCKGHLIVLWIILGVVTVGVISGIILAVTMN